MATVMVLDEDDTLTYEHGVGLDCRPCSRACKMEGGVRVLVRTAHTIIGVSAAL